MAKKTAPPTKPAEKLEKEFVGDHNIVKVAYDPQKEILEVEFKNRAKYDYFGVPQTIWTQISLKSEKEGMGDLFYSSIRNKFSYKIK